MNRNLFKVGVFAGVVSVAALGAGPALAAGDPVSQASAQSLNLQIAGNPVITQAVNATNDGTGEKKSGGDTIPDIAHLIPGNSLLGIGAAPQDAGANVDKDGNGTSYACAGAAGTGGGIVHTGNTSCNIDGKPLTLNLGSLKLGQLLIDNDSALGNIPGITELLNALGGTLDQVVSQLGSALKSTPLGDVSLEGTISAIEAVCTADPDSATGAVHFVDTSGKNSPISLTLPSVGKLTLVNLPANPDPNTHVVTGLDKVVSMLTSALSTELTTILNGKLDALGVPLSKLLTGQVQDLVNQLVSALQPVLKPLQDNVLDITLNKQPTPQKAKTFEATALDLQVLPAAAKLTGASLISGDIGYVKCGPNARVAAAPSKSASPSPSKAPSKGPKVPTNVDSGMGGNGGHADEILAASAALLAMLGAGGTLAYRRYGMPRG